MKALGVFNSPCFPSPLPTSRSSELPEAREAAGSLMQQDLQPVNTNALMLLRTNVHSLMLLVLHSHQLFPDPPFLPPPISEVQIINY